MRNAQWRTGRNSDEGGEGEELGGEFGAWEGAEGGEGNRVRDAEAAGADAAQRREVGAAA